MAFPVLETPHTELPDQTRLGDLDFSTENSIPSPSKDYHRGGNDLLKQIQGMRAQEPQQRTPLNRLPGGDRRNNNGGNRNEFTPLLKSATHNNRVLHSSSRFPRNGGYLDKENASKMKTPQALKASYRDESPALPLNSSVIQEEDTGSNADMDNTEDPAPPPVSSSSVSTPMTTLPRRGEGPLDHGRQHGYTAGARSRK